MAAVAAAVATIRTVLAIIVSLSITIISRELEYFPVRYTKDQTI